MIYLAPKPADLNGGQLADELAAVLPGTRVTAIAADVELRPPRPFTVAECSQVQAIVAAHVPIPPTVDEKTERLQLNRELLTKALAEVTGARLANEPPAAWAVSTIQAARAAIAAARQ